MKGKHFLIASFLFMLLLPSVLMFTNIEDSYKKKENRKLVTLKFTSLKEVKKNIINLKNFYKDNFGTRFLLYNFYKKNISETFNESPLLDKVIYGKEDWLFIGNSYNDAFSEAKGELVFTKEELFTIKKNISLAKQWCYENNIKFYICIVPGKHTIYKEYLPYKIKTQETKLDQVLKIYPDIIDLRSELLHEKKENQLYYKTDTHWNQIGAFYGYKKIMQSFLKKHKSVSFLKNEDIKSIDNDSIIGDLSKLIGREKYEKEFQLILKKSIGNQINKQLKVPLYHRLNPDSYEERYYNEEALNKEKIIFLRDSYTSNFVNLFRATFKESLFIYNHKFDKKIIIKEKPAILIYEIGERVVEVLKKIHE